MRYYLAQLNETNGGYEYEHTIRLKCAGDVVEALHDIAANWYENMADYEAENGKPLHGAQNVSNGDYLFNFGEVCVSVGNWQELDVTTFDALPDFIIVFNR
jgi:hypothetical protein